MVPAVQDLLPKGLVSRVKSASGRDSFTLLRVSDFFEVNYSNHCSVHLADWVFHSAGGSLLWGYQGGLVCGTRPPSFFHPPAAVLG